MSAKRPFAINPVLTAIAMGYKNGDLIADAVAPRVTVGGEQFKYTVHRMEHFDPEDRPGHRSTEDSGETCADAANDKNFPIARV